MEACCSRFTAAEGGARLAAAAATKNILAVEYASFIPVRLLYEKAYQIRGSLQDGRKRSAYVTRASRVNVVAYELKILTDLSVAQAKKYNDIDDWGAELDNKEVIVCTSIVLKNILEEGLLSIFNINVLILDSCHAVYEDSNLKYIMQKYKQCDSIQRPLILALTYPLFTATSEEAETSIDTTECSQDPTDRDNNSENEVGGIGTEESQIKIENGDSATETATVAAESKEARDDMIVADAERKEISIRDAENGGEEIKLAEMGVSDGEKTAAAEECQVIAIRDHKSETEESEDTKQYKELAIYDKNEKRDDVAVKKSPVRCDAGDVIGAYENLDDFDMYEKLEWKIEELEKELCCEMDLAEDIDGGKRFLAAVAKPRELIIEYSSRATVGDLSEEYVDLETYMRTTVDDAILFLQDHRHDPSEIYGDELYEEFLNIPDPTIEPKHILDQFLYVLDQLGPYAADKAAFSLLTKLEKLKIKVPYERHFLLFCVCTTVLVKIRCHADSVFSRYENDWDKIRAFCTPKVLRFAEILELFQPPENTIDKSVDTKVDIDRNDIVNRGDIKNVSDINIDGEHVAIDNIDSDSKTKGDSNSDSISKSDIRSQVDATIGDITMDATAKMLNDIKLCNFNELGDKIQNKVNSYEVNFKDINVINIDNGTHNKDINDTDDKGDGKTHGNTATSNVTSDIDTQSNAANIENDTQMTSINTKFDTKNVSDIVNSVPRNDITSASTKSKEVQIILNSNSNEVQNIHNSTSNEVQNILNSTSNEMQTVDSSVSCEVQRVVPGFTRRAGHRLRGRTRMQRNNAARVQQFQMNPDALCGVVYMKEALMAKIMFMLIVDMSRSNPRLGYLCAQYCGAERAAPPATEPRECQRQSKKQEEVLKKFRMHECNLLLATSALEEGIDLPRCNLVLRWDIPASYRSYGACRTRARAARSAAGLLCDSTGLPLHHLAVYRELDQIISRKCGCGVQDEPPQTDEDHADSLAGLVKPYTPNENSETRNTKNNDKKNDGKSITVSKSDATNDTNNETSIQDGASEGNNYRDINNLEINDEDVLKHDSCRITNGIVDTFNDLHITTDSADSERDRNICKRETDNTVEQKSDMNNENYDSRITINDIKVKEEETSNVSLDKTPNVIVNCQNISETDIRDINTNTKCNTSDSSVCRVSSSDISVNRKDISVSGSDIKKDINDTDAVASVDLNTAIALINRYCGKLPSDTFTRLAPQWWMEEVHLPVPGSGSTRAAYICTLRLPLNCPVKYNIVGHPMPTKVLARRMVALQACRILHKSGELDNQLMPIGKENFKAAELEGACGAGGAGVPADAGSAADACDAARPGTTKRRQYYYKRTAWAFTDCQPVEDASEPEVSTEDQPRSTPSPIVKESKPTGKRNMLYAIVSRLCCALPERYNTRGRRLHAPQLARQALGILMARPEPDSLQIPAFPVYTRSGEVRVSVEYVPDADVALTPRRAALVRRYMRFVFADVLRVRRRGMRLVSEGSTHNNYYIVPTHKTINDDGVTKIDIDWGFLELIYQHTEDKKNCELEKPMLWRQGEEDDSEEEEKEAKEQSKEGRVKKMENPLLSAGETFVFDAEKYKEAVVTPWYRNQDQPQFFLVAEICWNLTPDSAFPSATHSSFRNYYTNKYGVTLTQADQPLLDVDHTSARLNLLTPRYVNRKGVALPVSSERTRCAKRDRLDQKQILVPELCRLHPFAAPLWFATVALPCVLYRINALLIADEIRRAVAIDVGLGIPKISESTMPGFQWPPLDFGWSLAEVLSADTEKNEKKKEEDESKRQKETRDTIEHSSHMEENITPVGEREKTINDILQEREDAESGFEIGTWSNDMASSIPPVDEYDEYMEPLPPNLTFCTSASGGANWYDPVEKPKGQFNQSRAFSVADSDCSFISSDLDSDDSDLDFEGSDEDTDTSGFWSSKNSNAAMGVRIEYKTAHEAEAVDVERARPLRPAPPPDARDDARDRLRWRHRLRAGVAPHTYIQKFRESVTKHKQDIIAKGHLITRNQKITHILPPLKDQTRRAHQTATDQTIAQLFPYTTEKLILQNGQINLASIERNKRILLNKLKESLPSDVTKKMSCFSMVDIDIDSPGYVNEKQVNVGFDTRQKYEREVDEIQYEPYYEQRKRSEFNFDYQPKLEGHPGPSPSVILQALTMSNANDGINLERLETIGDSFLKFAITAYLYCAHPTVHEGKLSHMRSKQVSNLNLYRLGRSKRLGARMIASKFEPHDNWLPPCHKPPHTQHHAHVDTPNPEAPQDGTGCFIPYNLITQHSIPDKSIADCVEALIGAYLLECGPRGALLFMAWLGIRVLPCHHVPLNDNHPYVTRARAQRDTAQNPPSPPSPKRQRSSSPSSGESSAEEECGRRREPPPEPDWSWPGRRVGSLRPYQDQHGRWMQPIFGELKAPPSPLLRYIEDPEGELEQMLSGYDSLESTLQYRFQDRSLLLQALTHASHHTNRLTDCYQRLEFLGDAILDYLITRHLYEDPRRHSPGALTDLRSALVNNTIFATLAARHGFHKYFRHMSPGLNEVLTKYVRIQEENGHSISEEHYLIQEDEMEQAEDVEVPKALGDLFESVAGAIFLDSGMSLDAVWRSYGRLMGAELEAFSAAAPKSPVRELLEAEPDTAKFGKPERLADGRRVRVCVEVFGRGAFKGVGRNYRIAKGTAARCALRHLRAKRAR